VRLLVLLERNTVGYFIVQKLAVTISFLHPICRKGSHARSREFGQSSAQWEHHCNTVCFCVLYILNTNTTSNVFVNLDEHFLMCTSQHENNFPKSETFKGNRFDSIKEANIHKKLWENMMELALDRRHFLENKLFDLLSKRACLQHQHEFSQNYCTCSHIRQVWFTNCATHREVRLNFVKW